MEGGEHRNEGGERGGEHRSEGGEHGRGGRPFCRNREPLFPAQDPWLPESPGWSLVSSPLFFRDALQMSLALTWGNRNLRLLSILGSWCHGVCAKWVQRGREGTSFPRSWGTLHTWYNITLEASAGSQCLGQNKVIALVTVLSAWVSLTFGLILVASLWAEGVILLWLD